MSCSELSTDRAMERKKPCTAGQAYVTWDTSGGVACWSCDPISPGDEITTLVPAWEERRLVLDLDEERLIFQIIIYVIMTS